MPKRPPAVRPVASATRRARSGRARVIVDKPAKRSPGPVIAARWARLRMRWSSQRPDVGDHTRLVLRRRNRSVLGLGAVVIAGAVLTAVLILPVRAWINQRHELADRTRELAALNVANDELSAENDRLTTAEGIKDAARQDLGLIEDGETVIAMLPAPVSELMPSGWPYSMVGQILTARQASVIAAPPSTAPPITAPPTIVPVTATTPVPAAPAG